MIYAVGQGHDLDPATLLAINPQPASGGVQYARVSYSASSVHEENPFVPLRWDDSLSETEYVALLQQFGLVSAKIAPVTIRLPNDFYQAQVYNGEAVRPENVADRRRGFFVSGVVILIRKLVVNEY